MTTPRPPSFAAQVLDLKRRVKVLEANRRTPPIPTATTFFSDNAGNVVVSADGIGGEGLGRPSLAVHFVNAYDVEDSTGWPVTTSGTFADMAIGSHLVQHAWVTVYAAVNCGVDASAEVQLLDDTNIIAGPSTVDVGLVTTVVLTGQMISEYGNVTTLRLQTRRTAGTASVWSTVSGAWGIQTPV